MSSGIGGGGGRAGSTEGRYWGGGGGWGVNGGALWGGGRDCIQVLNTNFESI